jgi:tetratricopeptide (TPR) repeat protein
MSYINDALKKAQREKDGRYGPCGVIVSHQPGRPSRSSGKWALALALAAASALTALALWFGLSIFRESPADTKKRQSAGSPEMAALQPAASVQAGAPASGPVPLAEAEKPAGSGNTADAAALYREALSAQHRNEAAQAEDLYQRVLRIDPGHVHAMNNLGVLYMGQNRHDQAISLFERALLQKRHYADPYYNLACLYAQRGETGRALANLKSAIDIDEKVVEWARQDGDLTNIRSAEAFRKIMEKRNH